MRDARAETLGHARVGVVGEVAREVTGSRFDGIVARAHRKDLDRQLLEARPRSRYQRGKPVAKRHGSALESRRFGGDAEVCVACGLRKLVALALESALTSDIAPAVVASRSEDDERPLGGLLAAAARVEHHRAIEGGRESVDPLDGGGWSAGVHGEV